MFEFAKNLIPGALAAVAIYVAYVAVTKGTPAAWSMLKRWASRFGAWWNKAKTDVASMKGDVAQLKVRVAMLEQKAGVSPAAAPPAA